MNRFSLGEVLNLKLYRDVKSFTGFGWIVEADALNKPDYEWKFLVDYIPDSPEYIPDSYKATGFLHIDLNIYDF